MSEIKGVRPSVVELFETVRSHAEAYNRAFEKLKLEMEKNARAREEFAKDIERLHKEKNAAVKEIQDKAEDALHIVEYKAQNIEKLFEEVDAVRQLKNSLIKLEKSFKEHNYELDQLIQTIKDHTQNIVDVEFNKVERKLAAKLAAFQEEMKGFEKQLISFSDYQRREFGVLHEDVTNFKSKVSETKYIVDETTRIVENMLDKADKNMQEKMEWVTSEMEKYRQQVMGINKDAQKLDRGDIGGSLAYDELKIQIRELNQKLKSTETKFASIKFALYFVGAGMLIVILMLLFK